MGVVNDSQIPDVIREKSVIMKHPRVYAYNILNTLKVESFAGRNFRDFANFSVDRES